MKQVLMIIKSGSFAKTSASCHHPEIVAIRNLIEYSKEEYRFVLVGTTDEHPQTIIQSKDVITHDLRFGSGSFNFLRYILNLTLLLLRHRPRIVMILGYQIFPVWFYCKLSRHAQFVSIIIGEFNYHGYSKLGKMFWSLFWKLNWFSLKFSKSKLIAAYTLSRYTQQAIVRNVPVVQVQLLSYPISSVFKRRTEKPTGQKPVLLVNAGIEPRKGLDVLIKALPLLHRQVEVVVKGAIRDSRYMHELESLVHRLKLDNVVIFETSFYEDEKLASLYNKAAVFIFPTLEDCLGVAVLEALHCGLPVIGTNNSGVADMIVDRQNGLLVPPRSYSRLAAAINELLEDVTLQQFLAANTLKVLQKHYYDNRILLEQAMKRSIRRVSKRLQ